MEDAPPPQDPAKAGVGEALKRCYNAGEGDDEEMRQLLAMIDGIPPGEPE